MENLTETEIIAFLECDLEAAIAKIKELESVINGYESTLHD